MDVIMSEVPFEIRFFIKDALSIFGIFCSTHSRPNLHPIDFGHPVLHVSAEWDTWTCCDDRAKLLFFCFDAVVFLRVSAVKVPSDVLAFVNQWWAQLKSHSNVTRQGMCQAGLVERQEVRDHLDTPHLLAGKWSLECGQSRPTRRSK